jgi:hypothetical protein
MASSMSTALVPIDRCFTNGEQLALAAFLAGYRGSTREAYALDLRYPMGRATRPIRSASLPVRKPRFCR